MFEVSVYFCTHGVYVYVIWMEMYAWRHFVSAHFMEDISPCPLCKDTATVFLMLSKKNLSDRSENFLRLWTSFICTSVCLHATVGAWS